jgi:arabinose-5-phosphate isomerase
MSFVNYFQKHVDLLQACANSVELNQVDQLIELITTYHKVLLFTGVGKNGHVAAKAASTFCSIGVPAYFINPVDAIHGDMGLIQPDSLIIAVSKSGETEEMINFLQHARAKIVLVHGNPNNTLEKFAHLSVHIPVESECDDLNTVPTASIVIFTAFLQSVACEIARRNQLTRSQFVINHPGGTLGKSNTQ